MVTFTQLGGFICFTCVRTSANILLLFVQWLQRENYLKELSDVEHWLTGFYSLLCQEPVRDVEGGGYASGQQVIFDDQGMDAPCIK